ncbi:hypothetical protein [Thalassococcus sp. BH17M4-6]|uniref:hypothetical protein n=1 Tax=Thalassococcus sp. BH17M4-6 TaxID=3413148 RepID=UPI003BF4A44C
MIAALFLALATPGPATAQQAAEVELSFATALIRDILTAVNHGNWTGNYTVLRDYAASDFSAANDPTKLAGLFTPVREAGLDMLPILVTEPEILQAQTAARDTQMRLTGYFPTTPQHISFDMVFVRENRRWLLLDISVGQFDPIETPAQPGSE